MYNFAIIYMHIIYKLCNGFVPIANYNFLPRHLEQSTFFSHLSGVLLIIHVRTIQILDSQYLPLAAAPLATDTE